MNSLSVKLSNVMADIGVTRDMVNLRRHVYHLNQTLTSRINFILKDDYPIKCLFVGSQIEGSTTPGLKSDVDVLFYKSVFTTADHCGVPVKLLFNAVDSTMSFPQCCCLKNTYTVILKMGIRGRHQFRDFIKNTYIYEHFSETKIGLKNTTQRGPAFNLLDRVDLVLALYVCERPDECQVLFTRPKPGNWPKQETLAKAKSHGIFLTLPGNIGCTGEYISSNQTALMQVKHAYDFVSVQFRMSTIKTERLLMSNLNLVQIKTYIITKMIRKQFLGPPVGERLSSFHMKTSLLFTIEEFPQDLWRDENLVLCVIMCLSTLRRFLRRHYCPHYMVADVNLFAGKLQIHEFKVLIKVLNEMVDSGLICVYEFEIDNIDIRLAMNPDNVKLPSKLDYRSYIIKKLLTDLFHKLHINIFDKCLQRKESLFEEYKSILNYTFTKYIRCKFKNELKYVSHMVHNVLASCIASWHMMKGMPIPELIIKNYEESLCSGNSSNYLKYASMLVCTKQFDRAANVLAIVESMITPDVVPATSENWVKLSELQAQEGRLSPSEQIKEYLSKLAFEVFFSGSEVNCVPLHLQYEMYRTITELDEKERDNMKSPVFYTDCAVVDAEPFLYYLQYLSSSTIEAEENAVVNLIKYIERCFKVLKCRIETTIHMFSHICELKNLPEAAFINYVDSINIRPRNNAAYWHLFRLLGQLFYGYWTWNDENLPLIDFVYHE